MASILTHEPTDGEIQRVEAIAHRMGIANDDPILPIFVALECYHGVFSKLPQDVAEACDKIQSSAVKRVMESSEALADSALKKAQAELMRAVQGLVPSLQKEAGAAVEKAVSRAVQRETLGKSLWTMGAASLAVSALYCLGVLSGLGFAGRLPENVPLWTMLLAVAGGAGTATAGMYLILGGIVVENEEPKWRVIALVLGVSLLAACVFLAWRVR
jgi:hypothetical protein